FNDELRPRNRHNRGEGASVLVAEGSEAGPGPPVEVDDVDAVEARRHRSSDVAVGPQGQWGVPPSTAADARQEPTDDEGHPLPGGVPSDPGEAHHGGSHQGYGCDRERSTDGERGDSEDDPTSEQPALDHTETDEHSGAVERFESV